MPKTEMVVFDAREFNLNLEKFDKKVAKEGIRQGLGKAWVQLMRDIVSETPTAPILTGALRSSMTVFVGKDLFADSDAVRDAIGQTTEEGMLDFKERHNNEPVYTRGEEALLVMNAPYTVTQHEEFEHKRAAGAGRFFILTKVRKFARRYVEILVATIKRTKL